MPIRFNSGGFVIESDYCGDCESPLYDTGCDAPGCTGRSCPDCGTGCDIETDPDGGRCAEASAAESDEEYEDREDAERAACGLPSLSSASRRRTAWDGMPTTGGFSAGRD